MTHHPPSPADPADPEERVADLIRELRNGREVERHWPLLRQLVESDTAGVASRLSTRWLVSVCDTYADFAEPPRSCHALLISTFVNMLRLAETCRFTRPVIDEDRWSQARGRILPLYDGLTTFAIDRQDSYLNLSRRIRRQLEGDPLMKPFWLEILRRLHSGDNVITEFARDSRVADRYFPIDPSGMLDNYGR
jgi:hypothetical protein